MRIFDFPKSNTENSAKLNERKLRMGITAGMRKPCTERRQQLQTIWFRYSLNPEGNLTCYPSSVLSIFLTVKTINDMQCTCGKKPEGTKASSGIWPQPLASARNFLRTKEYTKVRYFTTGLVHSRSASVLKSCMEQTTGTAASIRPTVSTPSESGWWWAVAYFKAVISCRKGKITETSRLSWSG